MSTPFNLPPDMRIYNAETTRHALLTWTEAQLAQGAKQLEVSAREVQEIDGCGLQLLASLSNQALPWSLVDSNETFSGACQIMGFGHWLDKCDLQPASGGRAS